MKKYPIYLSSNTWVCMCLQLWFYMKNDFSDIWFIYIWVPCLKVNSLFIMYSLNNFLFKWKRIFQMKQSRKFMKWNLFNSYFYCEKIYRQYRYRFTVYRFIDNQMIDYQSQLWNQRMWNFTHLQNLTYNFLPKSIFQKVGL